ncbi:MAG TPA: VIT1/CCC1 transporter family protein [Gaiellaceae bacterium]|nr:VIT1/CCC1 transporter family protein [Gaiellaceae bacterium]
MLARRIAHYLPDLVYGANDGVITTFAVVTGVVGADLSRTIILILGFANLTADGISMGASNYLARRSTVEDEERQSRVDALRHGGATVIAFVVAGIVPLLAYLLPIPAGGRFETAIALTGLTLFAVGAGRSLFTGLSPLRSGLEMLLVGSLAAVAAYLIGALAAAVTGGIRA